MTPITYLSPREMHGEEGGGGVIVYVCTCACVSVCVCVCVYACMPAWVRRLETNADRMTAEIEV